ncbi:adenosylcobinamide-phosphate synthase CbiB [Niallia endozanthoxylica]|uniref:Cobalamin biosynthesis protein CobD n=1 Tax=Niallia endozanthoxylica TaxID=2036016 RepID=A0A5J5H8Z2_9BACI|nr:adenosylcobinamide-phosphate synthase CbiB [Niallia endozanthoxylica]KAA9017081.1 cobalamin biosynthesis protein [Niallia endozanthoxylica]
MLIEHALSITLAVIIDRIIGDPPSWPHPVKWFGKMIAFLDKQLNNGGAQTRKWKGVWMLLIIILAVLLPSLLICMAAYSIHPLVGILVEGIIIAATIAQKSLKDAALEVYEPLQKEDLKEARLKLSYIVGRDTEHLPEPEIVRGTVETVAENTSDGVTAPMFWALVGGAPLALVYRAINTCDSMVGYKNENYQDFGWASARMDDAVNWIPSRLTGFMMLLANRPLKTNRKETWRILFRDAKKHPSPNSGWCEAAAAALLGVQLGGINTYKGMVSNRARMGDPLVTLESKDILKMNRILSQTVDLFLILLWLGGVLVEMAVTWI